MPSILLDSTGKPIPQYKNAAGTAFEAVRGANGAMDINVKSNIATPAGTNVIGKIQPIDTNDVPFQMATIYKRVATCNTYAETDIWVPTAGKKIILKGIRLQNYTTVEDTVLGGIDTEDTPFIDICADANIIAQAALPPRHVLSDTTEKIFMLTQFSDETILFGEGLVLDIDQALNVVSDEANVTVNAWGYEI